MSGSKQRKVEDLSREELEMVVQEVYMTLYDEPDKDWGADELAEINEALTKKNLVPTGVKFELTDVIFVKREVEIPFKCSMCQGDLTKVENIRQNARGDQLDSVQCRKCLFVVAQAITIDLPAEANTRLRQAVQDLLAVEEEDEG